MADYVFGRLGQLLGPFSPGEEIINLISATNTNSQYRDMKLGIQTAIDTIVNINGKSIQIGRTGLYELDEIMSVSSIVFPNGAPENTIIDYVI